MDVLHPEDWSNSPDGSPSAFLTTSRSGRVKFLQRPAASPGDLCGHSNGISEGDLATHSAAQVEAAPRLPRGARWPMPPRCVGQGEEERGP